MVTVFYRIKYPLSAVFQILSLYFLSCTSGPERNQGQFFTTKIVYDSRQSGVEEVYTANGDGTGITRITFTDSAFFSCCPRWSPDHSQIVFISNREGDEELYIMNADGTNVRRLTHNPGDNWSPAWTPDGHQIAYLSGPENHANVLMIDVDGTNQQLLGNFVGEVSGDLDWAPDGYHLLFTSHRQGEPEQSYKLDLADKRVKKLFHLKPRNHSANASWTPDGKYIVFSSRDKGPLDIYRMNSDGSNVQQLTFSPHGTIGSWALAISPDGKQIVFSSDRNGKKPEWRNNVEIYVIDLDGTNLRRITANTWMDAHPDW